MSFFVHFMADKRLMAFYHFYLLFIYISYLNGLIALFYQVICLKFIAILILA